MSIVGRSEGAGDGGGADRVGCERAGDDATRKFNCYARRERFCY
jgi:hypothetical protein